MITTAIEVEAALDRWLEDGPPIAGVRSSLDACPVGRSILAEGTVPCLKVWQEGIYYLGKCQLPPPKGGSLSVAPHRSAFPDNRLVDDSP